MRIVTILEQQTIFDLALQELGSAEGVFDLLASNSSIRLDSELASGQELLVDTVAVNATMVQTYANNRIKPGNGTGSLVQVLGTGDGRAILTNTGKYIKIKIKK